MGNYDYANESLGDTLRNNKKTAIGIIAFLVGLLLLNFFIIPKFFQGESKPVTSITELVRDYDIKRGKMDSKVTVILFEDPQCPACQQLAKNESPKLEAYRDRVKFVYKYFRVIPGHTFSKEATSYIYAAEQIAGKGYELVEKSFNTNTAPQSLNKTEFLGYANDLGLNNSDIVSKANSKEVQNIVAQQEKDFEFSYPAIEGYSKAPMRINGTPGAAIIIDGKLQIVTSGNDKSVLVDPTKDFNASMITTFLEKYFNPNASSSTSPTVETIPVTPAPTPTPAQ